MDHIAIQQAVQIRFTAGIAAQEPMVVQDPKVARLGNRLIRRFGDLIRIAISLLDLCIEQLGQFLLVEGQQTHVESSVHQFRQFNGQDFIIPLGQVRGFIIRDAIGLNLLRGQVLGHMDRDLSQAQLQGGLEAGVAADNDAVGINHNGLAEAELLQTGRHGIHGAVIEAGIVLIGPDGVDAADFNGKWLGHRKISSNLGFFHPHLVPGDTWVRVVFVAFLTPSGPNPNWGYPHPNPCF